MNYSIQGDKVVAYSIVLGRLFLSIDYFIYFLREPTGAVCCLFFDETTSSSS